MEGITIIEARPDWITCTAKPGAKGEQLYEFLGEIQNAELAAGEKSKPFQFQGYTGEQVGTVRRGVRHDGILGVLSGPAAADYIADLAKCTDHWSRIDYCVTAIAADSARSPVDSAWEAHVDRSSEPLPTPPLTRVQAQAGGSTLYVGSRASAVFGRIYNKHVESRKVYPPGSWRWELELKRFASEKEQADWSTFAKSEDDVRSLIADQFTRWDLETPWEQLSEVDHAKAPRRVRDLDRSEKWLSEQVRSAALFIAQYRGRGRVLQLLGLDEDQ